MRHPVLAAIILGLVASAADAGLFGRAPLTPGGRDFQAYYDTESNLTWLADANYARSSGYDVDGAMTWQVAQAWIAHLNSARHLGIVSWRLPAAAPVGGGTYNLVERYDGTSDRGYNIAAPGTAHFRSQGNELAFLHYISLNRLSYYDVAGNVQAGWGRDFTGPFVNVGRSYSYWSGSLAAAGQPLAFSFEHGGQGPGNLVAPSYAWAVTDGDPLYSAEPPVLPANLRGRAPAQPGKNDYQAFYDIRLHITWAADANLAATRDLGVPGVKRSDASAGRMTWNRAQAWVSALNATGYLGAGNWRLTRVLDTDDPGCATVYSWSGTDCGYNVDAGTGEMAHLFYVTLQNSAAFDVDGIEQPCWYLFPVNCLESRGPFSNLFPQDYWSGTADASDGQRAWSFSNASGLQFSAAKSETYGAWPVHDGDIDPTPDLDADGVADDADNCVERANPDQYDSDGDGYGNRCDADLNNNGVVNAQDLVILRSRLGSGDADADFNHNGVVNAQDVVILRSLLDSPPGPSGLVP